MQYRLGLFYYESPDLSGDDGKALYWFTKAADQGNAKAQFYLGQMYRYGKGVTQNTRIAMYWLRRADNAESAYSVARMYSEGKNEIVIDKKIVFAIDNYSAFDWYTKAATGGNKQAQYDLSYLYKKGYGGDEDAKKDDEKADDWADIAFNQKGAIVESDTEKEDYDNKIEILKGKDFIVEIENIAEPDMRQDLVFGVTLSNGKYIESFIDQNKVKTSMENWHIPGGSITLVDIFHNGGREVIQLESDEWFPRGEGSMGYVSLYVVKDDGIMNVLGLLLERIKEAPELDPSDTDNTADNTEDANSDTTKTQESTGLNFSASYKIIYKEGALPEIEYDYADDQESGTLRFIWKNDHFEEPTGKFKKLNERYEGL